MTCKGALAGVYAIWLEDWVYLFLKSGSMRQGSNNQSNRRGRGRGHNHQRRHNNNHGGNRNQTFDSNGPQGRLRGTAKQLCEKYLQLAKDAISSGDRVLAESLFQHADHYGRIAALFAPKPKVEDSQTTEADVSDNDTDEENSSDVEESDVKTVEIQDSETVAEEKPLAVEEAAQAQEAVEEKPKRRTTRRTTTRKKADEETPKLGGGSNAVPDFLARPVDVDSEEKAKGEDTAQEAVEEKPKRRTTRRTTTTRKTTTTRTRRKKADEDAQSADVSSEEKEAS